MQKALTLYDTTIGKKAVLAVTGIVLFGFVIAHMLGNLQVFLGPEQLNGYAKKLHDLGPLLWAARGVLLLSVIAHIVVAIQLVSRSTAARAVGYRLQKSAITSYAARTMKISGPLLALFIVYHLAHFTAPGVPMGSYEHSRTDVYANVVSAFSIPWVSGVYIVAQLLLGFHLYHGAWSLLQTLGLSHPRYDGKLRTVAQTIAMVVVFGNLSMPIAVLAGVVK
ncbi:MAG: succinate dehydrogenase cytochrome b subunit [Polyangiaceae bacterium]|nr:succinate dehydrogenase cytochrome b subunit [Polyangiaceae bacterium]